MSASRTPTTQDSDDMSTCCTSSDLDYLVFIVLFCLIRLTLILEELRDFKKRIEFNIDELLTINNDGLMKKYTKGMYPAELDRTHENSKNDKSAS